MAKTFKAFVLERSGEKVTGALKEVSQDALPEGEVTVSVRYSSLNYKDGLALLGKPGVVKGYPMVPGIDLAGTVEASDVPAFKQGDPVLLTGWGVGERHWGGYAEKARLKAKWLTPLPKGLSAKQAMAIGTAGLTAMLCVIALEEHGLEAGAGEVVVTGATGGVGSVAVALLSRLGHAVAASTGRANLADYLEGLGAAKLIERAEHAQGPKRPLGPERWAGAVDTVGGKTLAALLPEMRYGASVAACGLVGGVELATTVFPFILRGVNLLGIDSVYCPLARRAEAWRRLARDLDLAKLDAMTTTVPLGEVARLAPEILKGQVRGRTVVEIGG